MLQFLMPSDGGFFDLFREISRLTGESAREFSRMLDGEPAARAASYRKIKDFEHAADEIAHKAMVTLHKTFLTPLDRDDIHTLIKRLDDVLDYIDSAAERMSLYDVGVVPQEMRLLADINIKSVDLVGGAVGMLSNLKSTDLLMKTCVDINRLENEADVVLRAAVADLFDHEPDTRRLIKLKEIYELLETVSDRCEDVANVIETIVIEYA